MGLSARRGPIVATGVSPVGTAAHLSQFAVCIKSAVVCTCRRTSCFRGSLKRPTAHLNLGAFNGTQRTHMSAFLSALTLESEVGAGVERGNRWRSERRGVVVATVVPCPLTSPRTAC